MLGKLIAFANPVAGAAMGGAKVAWPIVKKLWWSIPMALLVAGILITRHTLSLRTHRLEECNRKVAAVEVKLQVTQTSLDGALAQINDNNKRIEAANVRREQDKQQAAADLARANARYEATGARVKSLEGSARRTDLPACQVSPTALEGLAGL